MVQSERRCLSPQNSCATPGLYPQGTWPPPVSQRSAISAADIFGRKSDFQTFLEAAFQLVCWVHENNILLPSFETLSRRSDNNYTFRATLIHLITARKKNVSFNAVKVDDQRSCLWVIGWPETPTQAAPMCRLGKCTFSEIEATMMS